MLYVLGGPDGHTPVAVQPFRDDLSADALASWAKVVFGDIEGRRVGFTDLPGGWVSTVFLGLDHNFGSRGPPLLFETAAQLAGEVEVRQRYATWDEAAAGHARIVADLQRRYAAGDK